MGEALDAIETLDRPVGGSGLDANAPPDREKHGEQNEHGCHQPGAVERHRPVADGAPVFTLRLHQDPILFVGKRHGALYPFARLTPKIRVARAAEGAAGHLALGLRRRAIVESGRPGQRGRAAIEKDQRERQRTGHPVARGPENLHVDLSARIIGLGVIGVGTQCGCEGHPASPPRWACLVRRDTSPSGTAKRGLAHPPCTTKARE